ncbi:MAG: MarR family transcriptional regulator [Phycisphaerales bacterium]|nr:MAG: MarR family transcriptional regulator [Phycisphaerales bacterium]
MPDTQETMDKMVEEIFELYKVISAARQRRPAGSEDLSEAEFLTLDQLAKEEPLTIGEVQKRIGVVPAQMSRIARALEEQSGRGYVECKINPQDRRRVDIFLTPAGKKAYEDYRTTRMSSMYGVLRALAPEDRFEFMRMLREIRTAFEKQLGGE